MEIEQNSNRTELF